MKLVVNGDKVDVRVCTLSDLADHYQLNKGHVVAEVDGEIIDREQWATYELMEESTVEFVHFVGGG